MPANPNVQLTTQRRRPTRKSGKRGSLVYLRRFCANDEASTSAAIRQAVARLDAFFSDGDALPDRLVVIYRNLQPQSVTLDVAMPVSSAVEIPKGSELRVGLMPAEGDLAVMAKAGFGGLLAARDELCAQVGRNGDLSGLAFWQSFDTADFRPWSGHPQTPLHLAA